MLFSSKQKIKVVISEIDKPRFDYLFEKFTFIIRGLEISDPEIIPATKELTYIITLESKSYYYFIIETLALNGFTIVSNDEKVNQIINSVKQKYKDDLAKYADEQYSKRRVDKKHDALDLLTNEGRYKELIKISKDVTFNPETMEKARTAITLSVNNAVVQSIEKSSTYKTSVEEAIDTLIAISSDKELKLFNCDDLMSQAGMIAIELCAKNDKNIQYLIKIANQKNIDYLLNIRASIKFFDIISSNAEKYDLNIKNAVKGLNTRWLLSIIDLVNDKLSEEEMKSFNSLIDFFKNRR